MPNANQVHKYYFDHPEVFEAIHSHRFQPETDFLIQLFQQNAEISRVLDVACGTGGHAACLAQAGFSVTGVDLNEQMIQFAHAKHHAIDFQVGDMRALPFVERFDAVLCLCTSFSYNTTNEEVVAALQSFRRALRPGGLVIIDVFNPIRLIETRGFRDEMKETYPGLDLYSLIEPTIDAQRQHLVERHTIYNAQHAPIQTDVTRYRLFSLRNSAISWKRTGLATPGFSARLPSTPTIWMASP